MFALLLVAERATRSRMKPARLKSVTTLGFEPFWQWLKLHPHCILRAGTPESLLFDEEDFHWEFMVDPEGLYIVQLVRGKRPVGELAISAQDISYVQVESESEEEHLFELITEHKKEAPRRVSLRHVPRCRGRGPRIGRLPRRVRRRRAHPLAALTF